MRHTITYNGINLREFGCYVSGEGAWEKPSPDITRTSVPGRNGDLTIFNKRYNNVVFFYMIGITKDFDKDFSDLVSFLFSDSGYHKLTDSAHQGVYRMAMVETGISPEMGALLQSGMFTMKFNCQPQVLLEEGDVPIELTASESIMNPTMFEAKPLIRVYGTGNLTIGNDVISILENDSYIDIDCDLQDAYRGTQNLNGSISLASGQFPVLKPGRNSVTLESEIAKVVVTPKWWRL